MAGKRGLRKIGRDFRKPKHKRYNDRQQRSRNKIKRMLKSNGFEFTMAWAQERNCVRLVGRHES